MDKINEDAGKLRTVQVYIRGSNHTPPSPQDVSLYMMQWIRWLESVDASHYDPIIRIALAHHGFEALHPFTDGNGRVGRLLMNLMLMQEGYPPALVLREWRTRYITALQAGNRGDYTDLVNLIGLAVEHSLDLYLEACQASATHLVPLKELAGIFELDNNYLGQLARLGKIEATKRGSFWYASREAIQKYLQEVKEQPKGRRTRKK
jgi:Fic family protein